MEAYRLDFCCGGTKALADAAAEVGMQEAELEELLTALDLPPVPQTGEVGSGRNAALAHDIVDTHHAYMWEEMPRLGALIEKVHRVHGDRHPELRVVLETYNQMIAELDPHMTREERSVFPVISKLDKGESPRWRGVVQQLGVVGRRRADGRKVDREIQTHHDGGEGVGGSRRPCIGPGRVFRGRGLRRG